MKEKGRKKTEGKEIKHSIGWGEGDKERGGGGGG